MKRLDNVAEDFKIWLQSRDLQHVSQFLGWYGNLPAYFSVIWKYSFTSMEVLHYNTAINV